MLYFPLGCVILEGIERTCIKCIRNLSSAFYNIPNRAIHKGEDKPCIIKGSSKITSPYSKGKPKKEL